MTAYLGIPTGSNVHWVWNGSAWVLQPYGGGGSGNNEASYVVLGLTSSLTNERVLTAGAGISITDNGPNSSVVISTNGSSNRIMRYDITHETATTTQPSSSVESIGMTYFDQSTLPIGTKSYYFKSILAPSTGSTVAYLEQRNHLRSPSDNSGFDRYRFLHYIHLFF